MAEHKKNWRTLAQAAAKDKDCGKLVALVGEMADALDEVDRGQYRPSQPLPDLEHIAKRLLFVDDEPNIRLTLPPILERFGFQVRLAASVPEALEAIKTHRFDVLLSDLNIGEEGDGFKVVKAMREANGLSVTMLLTGYPAFETTLQAIHDEVDDYFVKPADIDSLVSAIERKLLSRAALESTRAK